MRYLIYAAIIALAFLHQDFWYWDDIDPLVFGFIPVGLAYHAGVSLVAAGLWALALKYCWPEGVDDEDDATAPGSEAAA